MEIKYLSENLTKLSKQRNFLLLLLIITLGINLLLSIKIFATEARVVIVPPGFSQPMSISNNNVSNSYLEEMSHIFLANLLDLNASNIEYKQKLVLKYAIYGGYDDLRKYFDEQRNNHKEFDLRTEFTVKDLEIDANSLVVIARGFLSVKFGKTGTEEREVAYRLKYDYSAGVLRVKEFKELVEEKENLNSEGNNNE
ncbi:MAG: hypothetical protein K0R02_700 [Rickettsiaceae bacterium]|jgi:type IV conjugative transfer system protein TraE|nr:hypothetical protein [Rickettsiaceae bacterium]